MKIVCCSNMPFAREAFSTLGHAVLMDGRAIQSEHVRDAEILAIRSTTKVDRTLIAGSSVRFVGTATIGFDHIDTAYLEQAGIRWCYAPGCNAESVAEYVITALLCLANRHGFRLEGMTLGVIGVGNVGSRVARKAAALGMRVLLNDPPRQRLQKLACCEPAETFHDLPAVLFESDILTLHVPLTKTGPDPTFRMANDAFFRQARRGSIFLNTSRGAVADTAAVLRAIEAGIIAHAVIDTWDPEPAFPTRLMERVDIGTPHIAGYSFDGKVRGTEIVYGAACEFLRVPPVWSAAPCLPPPPVPEIVLDCSLFSGPDGAQPDEAVLWSVARRVYDIESDDRRLREASSLPDDARAAHFDIMRKQYPVRREFPFTITRLKNAPDRIAAKIAALGFQCRKEQ